VDSWNQLRLWVACRRCLCGTWITQAGGLAAQVPSVPFLIHTPTSEPAQPPLNGASALEAGGCAATLGQVSPTPVPGTHCTGGALAMQRAVAALSARRSPHRWPRHWRRATA
jgi:hypothetical protein